MTKFFLAVCAAVAAVGVHGEASDRARAAESDSIELADGRSVECRVLLETNAKLVYLSNGRLKETARHEVRSARTRERGVSEYLERLDAIDVRNVGELEDLGRFAEQIGLPGEARNTWLRVLSLEPEHEAAWKALGGVLTPRGWTVKRDGRWLTWAELRARERQWKSALELSTAHFDLRTDLELERALGIAVDLERAHRTFYDVLRSLELYVFDERPAVHVCTRREDAASPPRPGESAWFDRVANVLHVDASEHVDPGAIVAELVDALVFNAFKKTLGPHGRIEPWALEGMAFAFGTAVHPASGRTTFDFEKPWRPHFRAQARDARPLSLQKVLLAGRGSFDNGADAARYAVQSYTLVHFLVFHEGGKHRAGFARFLKRSYEGRAGSWNFAELIGADAGELEREWADYVARIAHG